MQNLRVVSLLRRIRTWSVELSIGSWRHSRGLLLQSLPQTGKKSKPPEPAQQGVGLKMAAHPLLLDTSTPAPQSKKDRYKPMQPKFASIKVSNRFIRSQFKILINIARPTPGMPPHPHRYPRLPWHLRTLRIRIRLGPRRPLQIKVSKGPRKSGVEGPSGLIRRGSTYRLRTR